MNSDAMAKEGEVKFESEESSSEDSVDEIVSYLTSPSEEECHKVENKYTFCEKQKSGNEVHVLEQSETLSVNNARGRKVLGLHLANPLTIPWERRVQTVSLLAWTLCPLTCLLVTVQVAMLLVTPLCLVPLIYLMWWYFWPEVSTYDTRFSTSVRSLRIWKFIRDFFPVRLVKTAELDPNRRYIFGHHPHGIIPFGGFVNFATEANDFSKTFPGIKPYLLSLIAMHRLPIFREIISFLGIGNVSRESITYKLKKPGTACVIVIGGALEVLDVHPGSYNLTLKDRKGFVKLALELGVDLVPVISFGENDTYKTVTAQHKSRIWHLQRKVQQLLTWALPIFIGRGIFIYNFGFLPFRVPITTVGIQLFGDDRSSAC